MDGRIKPSILHNARRVLPEADVKVLHDVLVFFFDKCTKKDLGIEEPSVDPEAVTSRFRFSILTPVEEDIAFRTIETQLCAHILLGKLYKAHATFCKEETRWCFTFVCWLSSADESECVGCPLDRAPAEKRSLVIDSSFSKGVSLLASERLLETVNNFNSMMVNASERQTLMSMELKYNEDEKRWALVYWPIFSFSVDFLRDRVFRAYESFIYDLVFTADNAIWIVLNENTLFNKKSKKRALE